ncbi:hypothetical protein EV426DRAFT_592639 [Tirmania nivea]|nr:hypothetical protein EV426DRAFT_592639 [Tirmania nivea]
MQTPALHILDFHLQGAWAYLSSQCSPGTVNLQGAWAYLSSQYSPRTVKLAGTYLLQLASVVLPCRALDLLLPALAPKFSLRPKPGPTETTKRTAGAARYLSCDTQQSCCPPSLYDSRGIYATRGRALPHVPSPAILLRVQTVHHLFPCPVSWTSQYAHPVQLGLATLVGTFHHSGYDFFGKAARAHDRHHERSRGTMERWVFWIGGMGYVPMRKMQYRSVLAVFFKDTPIIVPQAPRNILLRCLKLCWRIL